MQQQIFISKGGEVQGDVWELTAERVRLW